MASLNRAAWLPSKVTKLRSGKMEQRPGGGAEASQVMAVLGGRAGDSEARVRVGILGDPSNHSTEC